MIRFQLKREMHKKRKVSSLKETELETKTLFLKNTYGSTLGLLPSKRESINILIHIIASRIANRTDLIMESHGAYLQGCMCNIHLNEKAIC